MSVFAPQEYSERLADAAGEGFDASTARRYAGNSYPRQPEPDSDGYQGDDAEPE